MAVCVIGEPDPAMSMLGSASGSSSPKLSLSVEKVLEKAQATGMVDLAARNLKCFPKNGCKYRLKDTIVADLSRNKLSELPPECTDYSSLEQLVLYHNTIRTIPESVVCLQALQYLTLSRNQLSYLPDTICQLTSLKGLVVNNNKLVSLPEEIGKMQSLTELDASCNEIAHLPVQIGDMVSLRSLNLRRNHLQEVPVEIAFLKLIHLDLSGNRITNLPVELRFMTTVVSLELGENPLSCPPANLVSRGQIHIFKYLEIQAIREDRKRGVLTDSEYRRSYRKTTSGQLNDFRFANGFGADARRKRHTADSGYGSEQPLDRRWSQDFSQDAIDMHTEDARRIIMRAANCPRSPQRPAGVQGPAMAAANILNVIGSRVSATVSSPPVFVQPQPPPLTSTGSNSSSGSSSGHSSMSGGAIPSPPIDAVPSPVPSSNSSTGTVPIENSLRSPCASVGHHRNSGLPIHVPLSPSRQSSSASNLLDTSYDYHQENGKLAVNGSMSNSEGQLLMAENTDITSTISASSNGGGSSTSNVVSRGESPENEEKEEHRRVAHKVLGKQSNTHYASIPVPKFKSRSSSSSGPLSPRHTQPLMPPKTSLPLPVTQPSGQQKTQQIPTARHFKEHLRRQNASRLPDNTTENSNNDHSNANGYSNNTVRSSHYSSTYSSSSVRMQTATATSTTESSSRKSYDVKAMQKEAVLSYVKAKQYSPAHAAVIGENEERRSASPRPTNAARNAANTRNTGQTSSNIPQPGSVSQRYQIGQGRSLIAQANGVGGKHPQYSSPVAVKKADPYYDSTPNTTADSHIAQLKTTIESRLRIPLPENISAALADGVILCHVANHVKPRAVTSIHVPSASVPKLTPAKCKRNIENFILACKKMGVREDLICSPGDIFEPRKQGTVRVAITVSELLRFYQPRQGIGLPQPQNVNHHHQIGLQL